MTVKYVTTKKPELRGELMRTANPQWLDILKQINKRLGVGGIVPTKDGGLIGFRADPDNMTIELFKDGKWLPAKVVAGQQAAAADSGFAIISPNGAMIDKPLVLTDTLTLRALTASRLVSTDAAKALASVGDLTAWIGQGSANRVTVANDGDGTVTLSLPQDIDTAANVNFGTVTTTGQIKAGATGEAAILGGNLGINAWVLYRSDCGGVEFLSDGKVRVNISSGSAPAFLIGTALTGMLRADSGVVSVDSGTGYQVPLTFNSPLSNVANIVSFDFTVANTFTAIQKINVNNALALLVEQGGVKDNVFIVDTTNGRVGINQVPNAAAFLTVAGGTAGQICMVNSVGNKTYLRAHTNYTTQILNSGGALGILAVNTLEANYFRSNSVMSLWPNVNGMGTSGFSVLDKGQTVNNSYTIYQASTGYLQIGQEVLSGVAYAPTVPVPATQLEIAEIKALTGALADGYSAALTLDPEYSGVYTVTRHNYINVLDPGLTGSTVTDAAVLRFNAAAGTHLALAGTGGGVACTIGDGPAGSNAGTPLAWVKINVNGTLRYIPAW